MTGLFISGTDTGVGKTRVACAIVQALRERGLRIGVMKPVETGVGDAGPLDALALARAAGRLDDLAEISPFRFALPAAPSVAAAAEGADVDLKRIVTSFEIIRADSDLTLVEGAGGVRVPLTRDHDMLDLARLLELPILVVARASLGTINHTLLSLAEIRRRGLALAGVVISHPGGPISPPDEANLAALRDGLGESLVGVLPPLETDETPAEGWLDCDRLLAAISTNPGFATDSTNLTGPMDSTGSEKTTASQKGHLRYF
jgi:dethiobiotin synthetase